MTERSKLHPNALARSLIGRDYLSYSSLNTYRQCPLRFAFRYIQGLPEETVSSSLAFGRGVHAALEHHFNELMAGGPAPDQETLLTAFWDAWRGTVEEADIRLGKGETLTTVHQLAERVLKGFLLSEFLHPEGRLLGVEEELRGSIVATAPDLLARVDLLIETDDSLIVRDFKTSRGRWRESQAEDQAEQLLLYGELSRHLAPGKQLVLEFVVLTKTKQPEISRHPVAFDARRAARTRRVVQRVWQGITAGIFYPAPSSTNCPSCPYREPCRHWQG